MTTTEFNDKYKAFLEDRHYGLDISSPEVIDYLDKEFEILSTLPGFSYSQIKEKFGMARVYLSYDFNEKSTELEYGIDQIFKQLKDERKDITT